jgi:hypothetical protein
MLDPHFHSEAFKFVRRSPGNGERLPYSLRIWGAGSILMTRVHALALREQIAAVLAENGE